jgi:hypothetical protein
MLFNFEAACLLSPSIDNVRSRIETRLAQIRQDDPTS